MSEFWKALLSMIEEKDPVKRVSCNSSTVISNGRVVRLMMASIVCYVMVKYGIPGWPVATLAAIVMFSNEIGQALKMAQPDRVIEFAEKLIGRLGQGDVGGAGSSFSMMERSVKQINADDFSPAGGTIDKTDLEPPTEQSRPSDK